MEYPTASEWETERLLANPPVFMVLAMVVMAVIIYLPASWLAEEYLGWTWPQILLALLVAVFLVQGLPSEVGENSSPRQRLPFTIPLWIGRSIVLVLFTATYIAFSSMQGPTRWWFLLAMTLVIIPLMWFPLLQIRQSGLLSLLGSLAAPQVAAVIAVALAQIGVWGAVVAMWFTRDGVVVPVTLTLVAIGWHLVGNVIIARQMYRGHRMTERGSL